LSLTLATSTAERDTAASEIAQALRRLDQAVDGVRSAARSKLTRCRKSARLPAN
jgi:methyl-accepting chemotaxis protein